MGGSGTILTTLPVVMGGDKVPIKQLTSSSSATLAGGGAGEFGGLVVKEGERRTTHNIIEKRYRSSINDKILELKDLVMGSDSKVHKSGVLRKAIDYIRYLQQVHKSGVLRKAIDYIRYLQQVNQRLRQENLALKMGNHKNKLKNVDLSSLLDSDVEMKTDDFKQNLLMMSPPASDSGSAAEFSPYSIDSEPGSPLLDDAKVKQDPDCSPSSLGVPDRSRVLLCALTFLCLSFNPLSSLLGGRGSSLGSSPGEGPHGSGRTMLGIQNAGKLQGSAPYSLNLALSAVNLMESAGERFPPPLRAEIYVTAAIALRRALRRHCNCLTGYLLSCAEGVAPHLSDPRPAPDSLRWLFSPLGRQFFLSCDWTALLHLCKAMQSEAEPGGLAHCERASGYLQGSLNITMSQPSTQGVNKVRGGERRGERRRGEEREEGRGESQRVPAREPQHHHEPAQHSGSEQGEERERGERRERRGEARGEERGGERGERRERREPAGTCKGASTSP
ncbi:UNVERIFIED_CONTAM: hypothetical protein FKN15_027103 [Acipenser sinensis]